MARSSMDRSRGRWDGRGDPSRGETMGRDVRARAALLTLLCVLGRDDRVRGRPAGGPRHRGPLDRHADELRIRRRRRDPGPVHLRRRRGAWPPLSWRDGDRDREGLGNRGRRPGRARGHLRALGPARPPHRPPAPSDRECRDPAGAVQAENSTGGAGWTPPCPPSGRAPLPVHRLRACGPRPGSPTGCRSSGALDAIGGPPPSSGGRLVGTYER